MRTRRTLLVLGCTAGLVLAGCGDDDGGGDAGNGDGGDLEAFCELNTELDDQQDLPSDEQLDRIVELAPGEIRGATETLADAFRGDPDPDDFDEIFDDPEVIAADEEFEEFVQENCDD